MPLQDDTDPFSVDVIKEILPIRIPDPGLWEGFHFNKALESGLLRLNETDWNPLPSLKAHSLQLNLQHVSLPDLPPLDSPQADDSDNDQFESLDSESYQDGAEDVWTLPDIQKRKSKGELLSWDFFLSKSHAEPLSGYLSEAPPRTFNAIIEGIDRNRTLPVNTHILLNSLLELGMGRGSALFERQEEKNTFVPRWQNVVADGYSSSLLLSSFDVVSKIGTQARLLRQQFETLPRTSQLSRSRIAFLSASRSVLDAVNHYLEISRPRIASLLQLTSMVSNAGAVVTVLQQYSNAIESCISDDLILPTLIRQATTASSSHPGIDKMIQQLFSRTSRPALALLSEQVGLRLPQGGYRHLVGEEELEPTMLWETLFPLEYSQMIQETHQSLKLLEVYAPDSAILTSIRCCPSSLQALEPAYTFQAICELQTRSVAYEETMKSLITSTESSASSSSLSTPASEHFGLDAPAAFRPEESNEFRLETALFEKNVPFYNNSEPDELHHQVMLYLEEQEHEVSPFEISLEESFHLSITPLVSAQHRLLSFSIFQLLFQEHNLTAHLNLQRQFHFMGNAFFSSRLATALFDSGQSSGEERRHTGGSTGLRLQSRDTWPPASSELRLVLMGILSESLVGSKYKALEDSVSFAIRDMPPDELERCRDVDSIHALDFLRLQYRPANDILGSVLTQDILDKSDRVFQHLLRTLRLHSVTQSLLRQGSDPSLKQSNRKLVLEMHHFISTVADYYHNTAIEISWKKFEAVMQEAKLHIEHRDYDETLRVVKSQAHLRDLHERTVDNILHALLLKRKQLAVRQILEDIYGVILRFAAECRTANSTVSTTPMAEQFRTKVPQFMKALRTQSAASRHTSEPLEEMESELLDEDGNVFEYLLLRLDMSGYWTGRTRWTSAEVIA